MFVLDENSLTLKLYYSFPGELIYLRSSDRQEFWPALFEKAYAKYETSLYCLRLNVKTPVAFVMNIILSFFLILIIFKNTSILTSWVSDDAILNSPGEKFKKALLHEITK